MLPIASKITPSVCLKSRLTLSASSEVRLPCPIARWPRQGAALPGLHGRARISSASQSKRISRAKDISAPCGSDPSASASISMADVGAKTGLSSQSSSALAAEVLGQCQRLESATGPPPGKAHGAIEHSWHRCPAGSWSGPGPPGRRGAGVGRAHGSATDGGQEPPGGCETSRKVVSAGGSSRLQQRIGCSRIGVVNAVENGNALAPDDRGCGAGLSRSSRTSSTRIDGIVALGILGASAEHAQIGIDRAATCSCHRCSGSSPVRVRMRRAARRPGSPCRCPAAHAAG